MNQLSKSDSCLAAQVPDLGRIVAFRNILIHGYATVDDALVWQVLTERLPGLIGVLRRLRDAEDRPRAGDVLRIICAREIRGLRWKRTRPGVSRRRTPSATPCPASTGGSSARTRRTSWSGGRCCRSTSAGTSGWRSAR
ncbi:DUF86 domain-containing protein [Amycolatopsis sp. NPDC052450]|uniref:DUF86 domain-containing protein n=1 Tax=Amycolatopsis sp. NPDC052450 TaxID=3363937 RepID=UPI0037C9A0BA